MADTSPAGTTLDDRYDALLNLYHDGALDAAASGARALLAEHAGHAGTLQLLGVLEARRGHFDSALELLDRAIADAQAMASLHNNRGNVLVALGRNAEAVASYDRALDLGLEDAHALNNRGTALQSLQRFDAALASFDHAIECRPEFAEALLNRGELLIDMGRRGAGIESLQRARAAGSDDEKIAFALASLGVETHRGVAPPQFVRELFDNYAHNFDEHLTNQLGYRAHEFVARAVGDLGLTFAPAVVDLGCGTGLCGALLRSQASRLDGVDLSSSMLERAHRHEVYDELVCTELTAFLAERPSAYDVAVAADVLIYFGALEPVFAAVRAALRPGGWFVFSVEQSGGDEVHLQATRRFAHSAAYLERVAVQHGFVVQRLVSEVLRHEGRAEVPGLLAVLQRAGGTA